MDGQYDAVMMAKAAYDRLNLKENAYTLEVSFFHLYPKVSGIFFLKQHFFKIGGMQFFYFIKIETSVIMAFRSEVFI